MSADNTFYGWYDDATQPIDRPSYDPPHDAPCLFCGTKITADDVRTHSIMMQANDYWKRSYFYRTHRTCAKRASDTAMDQLIFAMIERNGD